MSYWDDIPENAPDRRRFLNDGIRANPALKGLFGWILGGTFSDQTTLAMIKALNSATRQEIQADKIDCWADGSYVSRIGNCITDPEAALNKAFRDISNLQDDDNVRKERIEAYIANRFYGEIKDQGGDEDAIQAVIDRYTAEGFYGTNRFIAIGGPDGTGTGTDEDSETTFEDVVEELGEGIANVSKGIYDEWSDKITDCVGNPADCIKKIGTAILESGGIPEECTNMPNGGTMCGTADDPRPCWKDCVTINAPGIPGLPIPLPPGVIDVGTYRDFENAVKTVGSTIGDLINGDTTVEEVFEKLEDWAREKWEEVFGGVDDATPEAVLDWLKGILGPVTAGIIYGEIEEEVTDILIPVAPETKDCKDANGVVYATVGDTEDCPEPPPIDCQAGSADYGNGCEPSCEYDTTIAASDQACVQPLTQVEEECNKQGKVYDELNDICKEECKNTEFVVLADGNCGPPETTQVECPKGTPKEYQMVDTLDDCGTDGYVPDCNSARPTGSWSPPEHYNAWNDACSEKHCWQDGSLISAHVEGDCTKGLISDTPSCDEITDDNYEACGKEKCADGSFADVGACGTETTVCEDPNRQQNDDGSCGDNCKDGTIAPETGLCPEPLTCQDDNATNTGEAGECVYNDCANGATDPENNCVTCPPGKVMGTDEDGMEACVDDGLSETCDNGKTVESGCQECPEGTTDDGAGGCQQVFVCDDPNATVVSGGPTAGACGPCKPGYVYDGAIEKCAKDGCPVGQMKDEAGNCVFVPIECPEEGEEFCASTGECARPQDCPGGPAEGGGGGGGGGGGLFSLDIGKFGIEGDPQLLNRPTFGQQDFLTPLFAESQGTQSSFPIAQFLANQKGKA